MEIIRKKDQEVGWDYFLDEQNKVLLDFTACSNHKNIMLSDIQTLCNKATSLKEQNGAYFIDDYEYLPKEKTEKYERALFLELESGVIKGQTYCCLNHYGKYRDIAKTYQKVLDFIKLNNCQIVGLPRERFLNGRWDKENEDDYVTKIMIPIKLNYEGQEIAKIDCYAVKNARIKLDDKKYREKYHQWLNFYWECIDTNPYVDPDMQEEGRKVRINPCFYNDLSTFLAKKKDGRKYQYKVQDKFISDGDGINLVSDQFGFSAPKILVTHPYEIYLQKCKQEGKDKELVIENVINWVMTSRTIGGSFLWPNDIWGGYNLHRGGSLIKSSYIQDRVDLTLLEIKHYLNKEASTEHDILKVKDKSKGQKWFSDFENFKAYVDYFDLNPFVDENRDYMPYDIVNSDMPNGIFKCLNDEALNQIKNKPQWLSNYLRTNSIFKLDATALERMFNNISHMIIARTYLMENIIKNK